jgi:enoyl-CoA hydratase/carnithine racemase
MVRIREDGTPEGFLAAVDEYQTVRYAVSDEGIGTLTLNRPEKLNAFDETMLRELRAVIWSANFDERVRVLVITGAGRGFCSGRDVEGLQWENNLVSPQYRAYVRANHETFDDLEALEKPVIAMVNGICAGGGVELAASCDFRIASTAAQFLLPEANLGVIPASGACSRLIQMIGMGRVKEMVMTAQPVDAEEAYRIGLANRVAAPERLLDETLAFARVLLARPPLAIGMAKHIINTCQNVDVETGRILERLGQSVLVRTADGQEGVAAFREKRRPQFRGR